MSRRTRRLLIAAGVLLLALLIGGRIAVTLYTETLWFGGLGYGSVYWRRIAAVTTVRTLAALIGAAIVYANLWWVVRRIGPVHVRRRYGNIEIAEKIPRRAVVLGAAIASLLAGWWLAEVAFDGRAAMDVYFWGRHAAFGIDDPLFGRDLGFHVFTMPVLEHLLAYLLLLVLWIAVLSGIGYVMTGSIRWDQNRVTVFPVALVHLASLLAAVVVLIGAAFWLSRYDLLLHGQGIAGSLGYTDVRARLPARWGVLLLSIAAAATIVHGARRRSWLAPALGMGALVLGGLVLGQALPGLVQRFQVEPNELAREAPYIEWNIAATRHAYGLDRVEPERLDYAPGAGGVDAATVAGLPRWDLDQLRDAFEVTQTFRSFYTFPRFDYDRYGPEGDRSQVAIAVRELTQEGVAAPSRTWQTLRLNPQYVRGMGALVSPVAEVDAEGEPVTWIANMDPIERAPGAPPELELTRPSVFFGEIMDGYVVLVPGRDSAFAGTPGVDFPDGVQLSSLLRVGAFAWRFGDKNLLFSTELTDQSRFVFRRLLHERLRALAPFLLWDPEAHPVVHDGRIVWVLDGYTASDRYPLSRPLAISESREVRYMRAAVKATVDAVTGDVRMYLLDPAEPLSRTYAAGFPGLFRPIDEMPDDLREHLRYPSLFMEAQARLLGEYHVQSASVFYSGQDVWEVSRTVVPEGGLRPYQPTYILAPLPGREQPEFLLTLPFVARERQNMTGMLVARSDPPDYGALRLLVLPPDQQVPGPSQIQANIEADARISQQLTLWRRAGSTVHLGHLRVVPVQGGLLYMQPLFLSAEENAIPQLQRVLVSDGRSVVMRPTLPEAITALRAGPDAAPVPAPLGEELGAQDDALVPPSAALGPRPVRALELLDRAEDRLRQGDWAGYGEEMDALRRLLERWSTGEEE